MAETAGTTLDRLIVLTREAAEQLQQVEAAISCRLAEISAEDVNTGACLSDAHAQSLVDGASEIRRLAYVHRSLRDRTACLCKEGAEIQHHDPAGRNHHCDEIADHHARLLYHLNQIHTCLASLRQKTA